MRDWILSQVQIWTVRRDPVAFLERVKSHLLESYGLFPLPWHKQLIYKSCDLVNYVQILVMSGKNRDPDFYRT